MKVPDASPRSIDLGCAVAAASQSPERTAVECEPQGRATAARQRKELVSKSEKEQHSASAHLHRLRHPRLTGSQLLRNSSESGRMHPTRRTCMDGGLNSRHGPAHVSPAHRGRHRALACLASHTGMALHGTRYPALLCVVVKELPWSLR